MGAPHEFRPRRKKRLFPKRRPYRKFVIVCLALAALISAAALTAPMPVERVYSVLRSE